MLEKRSLKSPGSEGSLRRIGTAEVATDPMPPNIADMLRDAQAARGVARSDARRKDDWSRKSTAAVEAVPGNNYEFTQPIQMRFNELISGVRSDVGVKIFGDDMDVLRRTGERVAKVLDKVAGDERVKVEQVTRPADAHHRLQARRHGALRPERRRSAGSHRSRDRWQGGGRSFRGRSAFPDRRAPAGRICATTSMRYARIPIALPAERRQCEERHAEARARAVRHFIPLGEVAELRAEQPGPNQISRESGKRRVVVTCNIRGRDIGSFVAEAQRANRRRSEATSRILDRRGAASLSSLQSATKRLQIVVPRRVAADFRPALHGVRQREGFIARLHRRAAGAHRRHPRPLVARHPAFAFPPASASSR